MPSAAVLTVSDRVSQGLAADESGPVLVELLRRRGFDVVQENVVPDDVSAITAALVSLCDKAQLVLTTGGTGLGPRDRTPEATQALADYLVPGLAEEMRRAGRERTPLAVLARGVCAVRGASLIVNLPGRPKGAVESVEAVIDALGHALDLLQGKTEHPA